ncbi:AraC family ligand binding domain-containing protein [Pseudomonas qingdaonensis]|nr:AraC family ligand binding domain-containing protein [Pseudomonas qingdaonensis]
MEQQDFSRFWRVPEGGCELLAARYSARAFGRHSHERYAVGVIGAGVEKLFYRGTQHLGTAGSIVTLTPGEMHDGVPGSAEVGATACSTSTRSGSTVRYSRAFRRRAYPPVPAGADPRHGLCPGLPAPASGDRAVVFEP